MKKFHINISLSSIGHALRHIVTENMNSDFLWRIVLGFALSIATGVAIFAWLSYDKITAEQPAPPSSKHISTALSIDKLRAVIDFYQKKEEDFKLLRSSPPRAPSLSGKGGARNILIDTRQEFDQTFL